MKEYHKQYYQKNKEKIDAQNNTWAKENPEKRKAIKQTWYTGNKIEYSLSRSVYRKANSAYYRLKGSEYRVRKLQATPTWITEEERLLISEVYSLAKSRTEESGFAWAVDHIVPLKGRLVCGLHVLSNLRVIPASTNFHKSNHFVIE